MDSGRPKRVRKPTEKMALLILAQQNAQEKKDSRLATAAAKAQVTGDVDELADLLGGMGIQQSEIDALAARFGSVGMGRRRKTRKGRKGRKSTRRH